MPRAISNQGATLSLPPPMASVIIIAKDKGK